MTTSLHLNSPTCVVDAIAEAYCLRGPKLPRRVCAGIGIEMWPSRLAQQEGGREPAIASPGFGTPARNIAYCCFDRHDRTHRAV